jgi:hypothetical protein
MKNFFNLHLSFLTTLAYSQDDLLNDHYESNGWNYTITAFKAQLVTLQTTKMPAKKEFILWVSHRFSSVENGLDSFFLDLIMPQQNLVVFMELQNGYQVFLDIR